MDEIKPFQIWDHVNGDPAASVRVVDIYHRIANEQPFVLIEARDGGRGLLTWAELRKWYRLNETLYRPSSSAYLMGLAVAASSKSTCDRARVGAVATINGRTLATGYNGAPAKAPHCQHRKHIRDKTVDPDLWVVDGRESCRRAIHAEANLFAYAVNAGVVLTGATIYTTTYPCVPCMNQMASSGIVKVIYGDDYKNNPYVEEIAKASGVTLERFSKWW